ncbi:NADH-quinone oxidoreductase subunit NuoE [Cellulosimicrobium marinum]|uniref:NADH-quinone oxidoreductase subunit NuoE n=1 Tax=Cellulosimicrobium marinum TaxID=1638992 RepID=UPI001E4ED7D3|nr:NADH-quinone oxidoreductase subunit NuoE [Cellulosimicrobium marinum]MCB7136849.1 NADH-quinone oxidoreductase subunit NuoE [Cellulosimicrobium marinum]
MTTDAGTTNGSSGGVRTRPGYDAETHARLAADAAQIVSRYPQPRSALLPMLHLVQSEDGYVSRDGILFCAEQLDLTAAEVSAVATFYTQYKRHPNGTYTVGVCTNTLCAIMGGDAIFDELSEHLGVGHDETTDDGAITLERVECNAACDYAPVMMVNWEFFDNQTPQSATDVVDRLRTGEPVAPTRGAASVCSFKQMSRVLAGFSDGRADEGVGAGDPTLVGLRLARERGWTAPATDQGSPSPDQRSPSPDQSSPAPDGETAAEAGEAASRAGGDAGEPEAGGVTPEPGEKQSSAEREPVTPEDTAPGGKPGTPEREGDASSPDERPASGTEEDA